MSFEEENVWLAGKVESEKNKNIELADKVRDCVKFSLSADINMIKVHICQVFGSFVSPESTNNCFV